jgi:Ca-activated chloride channel homolog
MNDEPRTFGLSCPQRGVPAPVLQGVVAQGRLDGVLFELTLRQTYRNESQRLLEVVYTFPLPHQAVLLGFSSELNGVRQVGTIVATEQAEQRYEDALADGDAPVLLEALGDGLHTANIGNLKPGDAIVLEVRFAQLLAFEQGRLRLSIPTTIAPRYGSAVQSGLQPQQVPQTSIHAEHALSLSVTVAGALAGGVVECPTHRFSRETRGDELRLVLDTDARLDRDVVILVTPKESLPSLVIQARDRLSTQAPVVVMAALQPRPSALREGVALKLLVDCSGSMGGDGIASARAALAGVLAALGTRDRVSLTRFGSTVEHLQAPTAWTPGLLPRLQRTVATIAADLGGTEMAAALASVFALPMQGDAVGVDVLLITDGEIWQVEETIATARASGHRVFAIGVGSSPAEGVLRSLAEATGGACEFATPGEGLEAAAVRMLHRMRQQPWQEIRIDWGGEPVWQTSLPSSAFGGDTVMAFAGMTRRATSSAVRLSGRGADGAVTEIARGEADAPASGDSLARISALRRMTAAHAAEALHLAITYQLLTKQTGCVLVHQRAEAERASQEAEMHHVTSMLAAGWGASGSVLSASTLRASGSVMKCMDVGVRYCMSIDHSPEVNSSVGPDPVVASLDELAALVFTHLYGGCEVADLAAYCTCLQLGPDLRLALDQAADIADNENTALILLASWANTRVDGTGHLFEACKLQPYLDAVERAVIDACRLVFERLIGAQTASAPGSNRSERLRLAMQKANAVT